MGAKTAARLLKNDTVPGALQAEMPFTREAVAIDGKEFKVVPGRDPAATPWRDLDLEVILESIGAFNSLKEGSTHLEAGAKKVVITAAKGVERKAINGEFGTAIPKDCSGYTG